MFPTVIGIDKILFVVRDCKSPSAPRSFPMVLGGLVFLLPTYIHEYKVCLCHSSYIPEDWVLLFLPNLVETFFLNFLSVNFFLKMSCSILPQLKHLAFIISSYYWKLLLLRKSLCHRHRVWVIIWLLDPTKRIISLVGIF